VDSPSQRDEQVSRQRIDSFLEEHRGLGYNAVNIHGGEPTTRKDFVDILRKIQDYGYPRVILQTNGRKLANKNFAEMAYSLGIDLFVISIHGKDAATHDAITAVPGSYNQAIQGIINVKGLGAKVRTNSVASKINYSEFPEIMALLISLRVDHINVSALHTAGAAYKNFDQVTPTYVEIEPYIKKSVEKANATGTVVTLEGFPYCTIRGLEHYVINWGKQKFKMMFRTFVLEDYADYMDRMMRVHGQPCLKCPHTKYCGGVYKEYIEFRGWDEFGVLDESTAIGLEALEDEATR
jgi:MoaA/NifB/PqqE/SkfB family radical SAM enzyme